MLKIFGRLQSRLLLVPLKEFITLFWHLEIQVTNYFVNPEKIGMNS